jgi:hypothetical protein
VLANAAEAIHSRVRAHISICASSVLAAVNYAVQGHADVELPNGQSRPVSLYFISIAESGDRKSSTDHEALRPVYAREAVLREHYDAILPTYQNDKLAYDRARDTALRSNAKADRAVIRQALDRLGRPALLAFFGDHRPSIPGLSEPGDARHTPYVILRLGAAVEAPQPSRVPRDLSPAELHHELLAELTR